VPRRTSARPNWPTASATRPTHPAAKILADYDAPGGLRDLATDKPLADALRIKPTEWEALLSMKLFGEVSKDGYVQLLITMRAVTGGGR